MTANEWLLLNGHSNSGFCQKCWDRAYWIAMDSEKSQHDAYYIAMAEADELAKKAVEEKK